jgi:hypothetical protein
MAQGASNLKINTVKSVLMATAAAPAGVQGGIILSLHDLPTLSQGILYIGLYMHSHRIFKGRNHIKGGIRGFLSRQA